MASDAKATFWPLAEMAGWLLAPLALASSNTGPEALDPALAFGFGDPTFDPFEAEQEGFDVKDQCPEAAPGCVCDIAADPGQGVVALEELLATAGKSGSRRYVVDCDSQVHPLTTARIGYEFLRSVEI